MNTSNGSNGHGSTTYDEESSTPATISSPEPEEYTYERAIQGYMNFAEAKVKTTMKTPGEKGINGNINFKISSMKKEPGGKIGEKLSELEQIRLRSKSTNDISGGNEAKQLPRVDVHKRRSLFENSDALDTTGVKSNDRFSKDFPGTKTIKERLSNLEKNNENVGKVNRSSGEVVPHIKDTISNLEKLKSMNGTSGKRLSNGDVSPQISIKERLSTLEKQNDDGITEKYKICSESVSPVSIKERMSTFDATSAKEISAKLTPERDAGFKEKLESFKLSEINQNEIVNNITGNSSNICSDSKQNAVKSIDRLNVQEDKIETGLEVTQNPEYSSEKSEEQDIQSKANTMESNSTPELIEPVSSSQEELTEFNKSMVVVDNAEENLASVEAIPKEIENETDAEVTATVCKREGNTNKGVEGCNEGIEAKEDTRTYSSQTNTTNNSGLPESSETIVTQMPLPVAPVPCPRLNISLSIDSISQKSAYSENNKIFSDKPQFGESRSIISLNKPRTRVRKLTPMLSSPNIPTSPSKTVCELQIIEEGEKSNQADEDQINGKSVAVRMTPGSVQSDLSQNDNEVQVRVQTRATHRRFY